MRDPPEISRPLQLGRYELVVEVGRGGMGSVFVAKTPDGELVAVKLLSAIADQSALRAFWREATLAGRISHPNVVRAIDFDQHENRPYIVMELVRGVSLARLLQLARSRNAVLPVDLAVFIVREVALGLHAAHELCDASGEPVGLVHRDVSPQNVLLGYDGRVLVVDFGIAKPANAERSTQHGMVKGKLGYVSPEQARGEPLDRRCDLFALGVVAYEVLTGRRLFSGGAPGTRLLRILTDPPADPAKVRPEVPAEVAQIVVACLARNRDQRPPNARAVAYVLAGWLGTQTRAPALARLVQQLFLAERAEMDARIDTALNSPLR